MPLPRIGLPPVFREGTILDYLIEIGVWLNGIHAWHEVLVASLEDAVEEKVGTEKLSHLYAELDSIFYSLEPDHETDEHASGGHDEATTEAGDETEEGVQ